MKIIPVIDYLNGNVVLAKKGERSKYQPISSRLTSKCDINSVITSILSLVEFKTIYIADLDGIQGQHANISLWSNLCARFPHIEFWIDIGSLTTSWVQLLTTHSNIRPILGTESYTDIQELTMGLQQINTLRPLLSIDIKNKKVLGPQNLLSDFKTWPKEIIVLSLHQVGSNMGPDIQAVQNISNQLTNHTLYYGGGIRNTEDIFQLKSLNISGVMVANSLHNGFLDKNSIENIISQ